MANVKWEGTKRVRGCLVATHGVDTLGWFAPGPVGWAWDFLGERLYRMGTLVAEGVKTIRDAVLYSLAYESGASDQQAAYTKAERAASQRSGARNILPFARHQEDYLE